MGIFWWRPRDGRHQLVIRVTVFPAAIFPASVCAALYHSVCIFCCATRLSWSASGRLIEKATSCRKPSDEQQQQSAPAKKKKSLARTGGGGNKKKNISLSFDCLNYILFVFISRLNPLPTSRTHSLTYSTVAPTSWSKESRCTNWNYENLKI